MIRRQAGQHISFYTLIYGYSFAVNAKNKIKYENPLMTHQLMFNSGHLLGRTAMRLVTKDGVGVAPVIQKLQPKKFIRIDKRSKKKLNFQSYGLSHVSSAKNAASATASPSPIAVAAWCCATSRSTVRRAWALSNAAAPAAPWARA